MKILFDGGVPRGLRKLFSDHEVFTVQWLGWGETVDGTLLKQAEPPAFDVFVTTDTNFPFQQNLTDRRLAILVLRNCYWPSLRPIASEVIASILALQPGEYREFVVPLPPRPPLRR